MFGYHRKRNLLSKFNLAFEWLTKKRSTTKVVLFHYERSVVMVVVMMCGGRTKLHMAMLLVAMLIFLFKLKRYVPDAVFF